MLKGINKIISPDLLCILAKMGHGDEIVFSDGNFPGEASDASSSVPTRAAYRNFCPPFSNCSRSTPTTTTSI
jgi:hypothetical protein